MIRADIGADIAASQFVARLGIANGCDSGMRLERELVRAIEAASEHRGAWTLNCSPADAGARARSGLDVTEAAPVPLHSNPGPEHVFVDPDTSRFTGVIEFGDAYLSHPALDFRRWAQPDDRTALMQGYGTDNGLTESFHGPVGPATLRPARER